MQQTIRYANKVENQQAFDPSTVLLHPSYHFVQPYARPYNAALTSPIPKKITPDREIVVNSLFSRPPLNRIKLRVKGRAQPISK